MTDRPVAVVTGASSGIGGATARALARSGFAVVLGARRVDRCARIAAEIDGTAVRLDVTDQESVDAFAAAVPDCRVLVNNAGGAHGLEPVAEADVEAWRWMFETNVLGSLRMTKALLPALIASGDGHVVTVTPRPGPTATPPDEPDRRARIGAEKRSDALVGRPVLVRRVAGRVPLDGLGHPLLGVTQDLRGLRLPVTDVAGRDLLGQRFGPGRGLLVEVGAGAVVRRGHDRPVPAGPVRHARRAVRGPRGPSTGPRRASSPRCRRRAPRA